MTYPSKIWKLSIEGGWIDLDKKTLTFLYKNWKGEEAIRHVSPHGIWFGKTQFHTTEQWLLSGYDYDRKANRDFALKDISFNKYSYCEWSEDEEGNWSCSKCTAVWIFPEEAPEDNSMSYCPECGRKIVKVSPYEEEVSEDE